MSYDYFIAGRYRNKERILDFARQLRSKGKSVYCFVDSVSTHEHVGSVESDAEESITAFEKLPDWWNHPSIRAVFEADMSAQRAAEQFILFLPAGKSAHIEAGAAYGMGKHCIVIGEQKEAESLYLIFDQHYETPDEFLKTVK